jgi:DNA-binding transcriptional ArsR family regulator
LTGTAPENYRRQIMDGPLARTLGVTKALANPARLRILAALERGESCVCQLTAVLSLAPSTVSAHLSELRRAGLILDRKDGKIVYYRLSGSSETKAWLKTLFVELREDTALAADRAFLDRVKSVDVETFCAAGPAWRKLPAFRADGAARRR